MCEWGVVLRERLVGRVLCLREGSIESGLSLGVMFFFVILLCDEGVRRLECTPKRFLVVSARLCEYGPRVLLLSPFLPIPQVHLIHVFRFDEYFFCVGTVLRLGFSEE